jgi:hypothetical protein
VAGFIAVRLASVGSTRPQITLQTLFEMPQRKKLSLFLYA